MTASPEKLHELLSYCIEFGKEMLTNAGDFYPFGATLGIDGQIGAHGGHNGEEHPAPHDIYRLLAESFTASAKEGAIAAAALAANVDIPAEYDPPAPEGIRVLLESDGFSRFIYIPYAIQISGFFSKKRSVALFEPISVQIDSGIFSHRADA